MRRRGVAQVRGYLFGFLYALLAVCTEVVALWFLYARKESADVDPHRTAIGEAVSVLAFSFLAASLWTFSFHAPHDGRGAEGEAPSPGGIRVVRLPAGVRRVASGVWVVMLALALAHLGAALTDNAEVWLATGMVVQGLDLIALICVIAAQVRVNL